jgi:formylglycine-generating enzyme required for sulfatase activity
VAIQKMRLGEIAAHVRVVTKPFDSFAKLPLGAGVHFLPLPLGKKFADYYSAGLLTSKDYPNLILEDQRVDTLAVPMLLAVATAPKGSDRAKKLDRFAERLRTQLPFLQKPPYDSRWREVDLGSAAPGWAHYGGPLDPPRPVQTAALSNGTMRDVSGASVPKAAASPPPPPPPPPPFRDCEQCPEMVSLPGGTFTMGSDEDATEKPVRSVTVAPYAIGRYPVTVAEWRQCVVVKACSFEPIRGGGFDDTPVHNVSWNDVRDYVAFLSQATQKNYRLPSEAEWEFAARGNTTTRYWWGDKLVPGIANCKGCGEPYDAATPVRVASLKPNPFGLQHMAGSVSQWVADCWHRNYQGAPKDGSVWDAPDCRERVLRGGSWLNDPSYLRAASRDFYDVGVRYPSHGFRVARSP